ncbi:unnamed protein product [Citrullus colocynthis]|uniref:Uncharacterized protein n=1 Tax=Citrullus colocynthis TaxID=252529 RepID=A0ABP0Z5B4_9ROSI
MLVSIMLSLSSHHFCFTLFQKFPIHLSPATAVSSLLQFRGIGVQSSVSFPPFSHIVSCFLPLKLFPAPPRLHHHLIASSFPTIFLSIGVCRRIEEKGSSWILDSYLGPRLDSLYSVSFPSCFSV